jgi:UDP:flavonoid glycosyltransferase YjiC (YdhE family)
MLPEQIREAVDQILAEPEYRANAENLQREFAAYDAEKKLTSLLEALVENQQVLVGWCNSEIALK